ncbi:MAG TPA: oligosaccharide flippase family protein [Candidatus Limnocylindrales bacterium]|nr:oligosaccharide flippase family protein [Candidatus Limnocylindrales bacterium]
MAPPAPPLLSPSAIRRATARAAGALATRQVLSQALHGAGAVALANILSVEEFGIYAIVVMAWSVLYLVSDVGLGAALVRQPHEPEIDDYRSVFTAQQLFVAAAIAVAWTMAPALASAYDRSDDVALVIRLAALALLPASLQTVPSIRLERHLQFDRLAVIEVGQALIFNAAAVGLALAGFGAAVSLGFALLARTMTGAILAHAAAPWPAGWRLSWPRLRRHLAFGVPFQGIALVALGKDAFIPVAVGVLAGEAAVGMLTWASWVGRAPVLPLFMMQRVYLPAFSRMLDHREQLGGFIGNVLFAANAAVAPAAAVVLVFAHRLPELVFGQQWEAAVPLVLPYWIAMLPLASAFPLFGLLGALGHARHAFALAAAQAAIMWSVGTALTLAFGPMGAACAAIAAAPAIAAAIPVARRTVAFDVAPAVAAPWVAAGAAALAMHLLHSRWPAASVVSLTAWALTTFGAYAAVLALLAPRRTRTMLGLLAQMAPARRRHGRAS